MEFTSEAVVALLGVLVSLFFAYFPGVKTWFDKLDPVQKPVYNLLTILAVWFGAYLYSCRADLACLDGSWERAVGVLFAALVANQTTFSFAVKQPKQRSFDQEIAKQLSTGGSADYD